LSTYRSKFEGRIAQSLAKRAVPFKYESIKLKFTQPAKERTYTPDFELPNSGVYVECKGKFTKEDRDKMLWVREKYPDLRLVILFMRARNPIRKGSKTTYANWADKHGFDWADWDTDKIPARWLKHAN